MSRKQHTAHKPIKPSTDDYRTVVRQKDKKYIGVLPLRFATKDVDGNDIIRTAEEMTALAEDNEN